MVVAIDWGLGLWAEHVLFLEQFVQVLGCLVLHLVSHLTLHVFSDYVDNSWSEVTVNVTSLGGHGFLLDLVVREVAWHTSLAMRHVYLEGHVTSIRV